MMTSFRAPLSHQWIFSPLFYRFPFAHIQYLDFPLKEFLTLYHKVCVHYTGVGHHNAHFQRFENYAKRVIFISLHHILLPSPPPPPLMTVCTRQFVLVTLLHHFVVTTCPVSVYSCLADCSLWWATAQVIKGVRCKITRQISCVRARTTLQPSQRHLPKFFCNSYSHPKILSIFILC